MDEWAWVWFHLARSSYELGRRGQSVWGGYLGGPCSGACRGAREVIARIR